MSPLPCLADSVRRATTDATATAVVDGDIRWSWNELDERADSVAWGLVRSGVGVGDRVALLAVPSAAAIAALHGVARIGAVVAPLGVDLTATELAAAADVIDPNLVVHDHGLETTAVALDRPVLDLADLIASRPRPEPVVLPPSDPIAPAVVVLTSGTTGRPKAVVLSTEALVASAEAWLAALPPATGWFLALGLGHVAGLGVVWRAALSGVPLVVLPRADAAGIMASLAGDLAPSHGSLVPTQLARLLDTVADAPPPPTLRAVLLGGGTIPPQLVERALRAGWPIVPTYGLSEAGSGVTALPSDQAATRPDSAGRALPGVEVRIGEPDDAGVGEIRVRTRARFTGYLGDPAGTSAALTRDGWLRTGDLGRLDAEGYLTVVDRRTDRIVAGGENISPAEVEAVLLGHPAIAEAAVVARRDATFGHVPIAAIVLARDAADAGDDALTRFCRDRLAGYKVPSTFVRLEALPRTAGGKVRRAELRARLDPAAGASPRDRHVERPGGMRLAYRSLGNGPVHLLLLHATLSTGGQLGALARALAESGAFTVHAVDRRGSGGSRLADPTPLAVEVHVDDLAAVLDAEGCRAAALVGVSFGGIVALEFAARMPERALAVVAYEPPYEALADSATRRAFAAVAATTERAYAAGGASSAAEAFMRGVAGDETWDRLPDRTRAFLAGEGDSAYVDASQLGLDPTGLSRIAVSATIVTGDASDPFYRPIAGALVNHIPGARHVHLPRMTHASPITDPTPIAEAVTAALAAAGVVATAHTAGATEESDA